MAVSVGKSNFKEVAKGAYMIEDDSGVFRAYCEPAEGLVASFACTFENKDEGDKLFGIMLKSCGVRTFETEVDEFASLPASMR